MRKGIELAKDSGLNKIQVEVDALIIHQLIKEVDDNEMHELGIIIQEIKATIDKYSEAQFLHVNREANMVAHKLAKLGMDMEESS